MWPNSLLGLLLSLIYGSRMSKDTIKPIINNPKVYYLLGHTQIAGRGPPATRFSDFTAGRKSLVLGVSSWWGAEEQVAAWCEDLPTLVGRREWLACINILSKCHSARKDTQMYFSTLHHLKKKIVWSPSVFLEGPWKLSSMIEGQHSWLELNLLRSDFQPIV